MKSTPMGFQAEKVRGIHRQYVFKREQQQLVATCDLTLQWNECPMDPPSRPKLPKFTRVKDAMFKVTINPAQRQIPDCEKH
jgi:hypothetical protein